MDFSGLVKRPVVAAILGGILGLLLGLLIGWVLMPVEVVDVPVSLLRSDLQEDYLRMAIDSYAFTGDPNAAMRRWYEIGPNAQALFLKIQQEATPQNAAAVKRFGDLLRSQNALAAPATGGAEEARPGLSLTALILIGLSVAVLLGVLGFLIYYFFRSGRGRGEVTPAMEAARLSREAEPTDYVAQGYGDPVARTMATYVLGDDLFDESFSIDSPAGEFLGEYGVGISETIGVGDPKKVTALEVWLFDKNDIKTATKVLMTPHAYHDPALRARLEAKGELVLVQPGAEVLLETDALQLLGRVVDVQFGAGPQPPNSYFERITLELAVWPKAR